MTGPDLDLLLEVAREAAAAAGRAALDWRLRADALAVEQKSGPADLVSQADRDAEAAARSVLARRRPHDAVLGEEGGERGPTGAALRWVVDPLDGTTNHLYGRDDWAVSVAVERVSDGAVLAGVVDQPAAGRSTWARAGGGTHRDGVPVRVRAPSSLGTALVELGLGRPPHRGLAGRLVERVDARVRDVRRGGSAATALAQVAGGLVDASWGPDLQRWDVAAGVLLVREAGGVVGDLDGPVSTGVPASGHVLAAGPELFEPLRTLLAQVYRD